MKFFIGLAVLVVLGGAVFFGINKVGLTKSQPIPVNQVQNQEKVNNSTGDMVNSSGEYTINELLSMNKPLKCSWKESAKGDKDVTNIIYINGKKFYQDVTMGDIGHSFTISNDDYLYIWHDFNEMATKIKNTDVKVTENSNQVKKQDSVGKEQKRDFVCEKWVVDNAVFTPPKDKNFKDVTDEMNQAVQEMNNGGLEKSKQQMCDLCKNAPNQELIDVCLQNAQCN